MNIVIRNEKETDFRKVEELAREAFWNLYFPGTDMHYVVNQMRGHKDFIKELSFVIEVDGKVEGAIFYTKSEIIQESGKNFQTVSFGPVFINPKLHRQGLGKRMIEHSIKEAKKIGCEAIITLGYPYHYEPFGFVGGKKYNISMGDGKFYKGLLALPLHEGALDKIKGWAQFSECLECSAVDAEEFDKKFPYKEKKTQASQKEYKVACALLDE